MKRIVRLFGAVMVAGLMLWAPGATAQQAAGGDVQYKSKTVYDFDDDVVEGDLQRPDQEFVGARGVSKHSSLIKIRADFIPEMLKSADDI